MPTQEMNQQDLISTIHEYDVDLLNNHLYLFPVSHDVNSINEGGVDHNMASRFVKNINMCKCANPERNLVIHMNTNGGDWDSGMAIYDAIKTYPHPVTIINYGCARSMSSIILQAADTKLTMPTGSFMFHQGTINASGTLRQANASITFANHQDTIMINIYLESMRKKGFLKDDKERRKWVVSKMERYEDVYLTADEAIEAGFFDAKYTGWEL